MDAWVGDLIIATTGAVVGAALVYVFAYGVKFTQAARAIATVARKQEQSNWRAKDPALRQRITNSYLFSILKLFMIGNMFWVGSSLVSDLAGMEEARQFDYIMAAFDMTGMIFFFATLAKMLRFTKLLKLD